MLLEQGGPIMPLILLAALLGYVLVVERAVVWARWHLLDRRLYLAGSQEELAMAVRSGSAPATPLQWLASFALEQQNTTPEERRQAMELAVLSRIPAVEARIATIGWLGSILPMLGLLGTVSGMIATFQELALSSSRQVLSVGLSEALWTTEVGLLGAVPLLAAHHVLSRLRSRWLNRLELTLALLGTTNVETSDAP